MYFENSGLEDVKTDIVTLTDIMRSNGLVSSTGWDFERVTYDRKFDLPEGIYYLRIFGVADPGGDIGSNEAEVTVLKPVLGKYYYPHGVEYGDDELWPVPLVEQCKKILASVQADLRALGVTVNR